MTSAKIRRSAALWIPCLALACARDPALPGAAADGRPHVFLIVADTLRADHLGAYGYPRGTSPVLDALASESLLFRRAISPAPWTSPSMASLFTGLYPSAHGLAAHERKAARTEASVLDDRFTTLAESFAAAGYATLGVTANAWVDPHLGFAQGFEGFVALKPKQRRYANAWRVNEVVLEQLTGKGTDRPIFLYVHYMDPHFPYEIPESEQHGCGELSVAGALGDHPEGVGRIVDQYDRAILSMDRQIGLLLRPLRRSGFLDAAIVAVVGDHGQQFHEHGTAGHGFTVHSEETWVPLWIRAEGLGGVEERTVSTLDLHPTLLALAGLPVPDGLQGTVLTEAADRRPGALSEGIYAGRGPNRRALVAADGLRLVLEFPGLPRDATPRHESVIGVFDPALDPTEQVPIRNHPRERELLEAFYEIHRQSLDLRVEAAQTELDREAVERLRALGYGE